MRILIPLSLLCVVASVSHCSRYDPSAHLDEREKKLYAEALRELAAARKAAECLTRSAEEAEQVLGGAGRGQRKDGLITERSNRNRLVFIGRRQVTFTRLRNCCVFKTDRPGSIPGHNMNSQEIRAARASAECLKNRAENMEGLISALESEVPESGAAEHRTRLLGDMYNSIRWMHECCPFTSGLAIGFPQPPSARVPLSLPLPEPPPPPPAPPPPSGRVRIEPDFRISPAGEIDGNDARRRLIDLRNKIQNCYRGLLKEDPSLRGRMSLAFVIHADGRVIQVEVVHDGVGHAALAECVTRLAKVIRFGKSEQGATLTLGLVFNPKS